MESLNCDLSQERNCLLFLVVTQTIPVIERWHRTTWRTILYKNDVQIYENGR